MDRIIGNIEEIELCISQLKKGKNSNIPDEIYDLRTLI
jgi:hypothetical protein